MAKIKDFTLVEPPLRGGMAVVYKGRNGSFLRAFKMVDPEKAADNPRLCAQFFKEIKLQAVLQHPNIVQVLNSFPYTTPEGRSVTVLEMEWLDGMDLQRYVEKWAQTGLDAKSVVRMALQVASAMAYAHSKNILHCDLKPSNLFRTRDGYIKVIDFGIGRVIGENANMVKNSGTVTVYTTTGQSTFKGTLAYASPEQQVGAKLTPASDIYSFGKTLHFLCTGTTDPSVDVRDAKLAAIVERCTRQNPTKRYQNFNEVSEALSGGGEKAQCPACGAMVDATAKFCPACGSPVAKPEPQATKCPQCGKAIKPDDKFCPNCGTPLTAAPPKPKPKPKPQPTRTVEGWWCHVCGKRTMNYADGNVKFCNWCGADASHLTPQYKDK